MTGSFGGLGRRLIDSPDAATQINHEECDFPKKVYCALGAAIVGANAMVPVKLGQFRTRSAIFDADPSAVIVTLFRDRFGTSRGTYRLPPTISDDFKIDEPVGESNLLAAIAILRALWAAQQKGFGLEVVDPHGLWKSAVRD